MMCKQTVGMGGSPGVAVIVGFLSDTAKLYPTSAEGATLLRGVRGFSPWKFGKVKAEQWHLEVSVALFSCQNQITKCTLCHEKHLKIFVIYLLNDFHADSFSNMLWHYASHHTVFNSNSIRKSIHLIAIFK